MKKTLTTFTLLNLMFNLAYAQVPIMLWESFFNGNLTGNDVSNSVITDSAANVFITGTSFQTFPMVAKSPTEFVLRIECCW